MAGTDDTSHYRTDTQLDVTEDEGLVVYDEFFRPLDFQEGEKHYSLCPRLNMMRFPVPDDRSPTGFSDNQRFEALTHIQRFIGIDHALQSLPSKHWSLFSSPLDRQSYIPEKGDPIGPILGTRSLLSCSDVNEARTRGDGKPQGLVDTRNPEVVSSLVKALDEAHPVPQILLDKLDYTQRKKTGGIGDKGMVKKDVPIAMSGIRRETGQIQ